MEDNDVKEVIAFAIDYCQREGTCVSMQDVWNEWWKKDHMVKDCYCRICGMGNKCPYYDDGKLINKNCAVRLGIKKSYMHMCELACKWIGMHASMFCLPSGVGWGVTYETNKAIDDFRDMVKQYVCDD